MAKQVGTEWIGTTNGVIFYKQNGIYYIRAKGRTGKQAPVAKAQASVLGKASSLSARIRTALKAILPGPVDRKLMYRFNNTLQQWLRTGQSQKTELVNGIAQLNGFSFYGYTTGGAFPVFMPVNRAADGDLSVQIPAFDSPNPISPLPFKGQILLKFIAVSCNLNDTADTKIYETELDIPYTGIPIPGRELTLPLQTGPGRLTVIALSINRGTAGILGVLYN